MTKSAKKLIEVALPLDAINKESARDKKLSSGHPTTLHYWWAPRPLPACRAVVFASLVDDPSSHPDRFPTLEAQDAERKRLFDLIERLIQWESRGNAEVINEAREEILRSTGGAPPTLLDPFCGRGLIPLEGQRLGLKVLASDLNPIPVLIAKTLLEVVPSFLDQPSVSQRGQSHLMAGAATPGEGFIADVRHYAAMVLERATPRLEPLFPPYRVTPEIADQYPHLQPFLNHDLPLMGWLWARTVTCSNPSCRGTLPLVGSFWLSQKKGRRFWLEPVVDSPATKVRFEIRTGSGEAPPPTKVPRTGGTFRCPICSQTSDDRYVEEEGEAGRIGQQLMACIADGGRLHGRVYLPADPEQSEAANATRSSWRPDYPMPDYSQALPTAKHGVHTWADVFTERQLAVLEALSDEVARIGDQIVTDAREAGLSDDSLSLSEGGRGARAYSDGLITFLGIGLGKYVNRSSAFCFWDSGSEKVQQPFAQQGIQKTWDFVEVNPFSTSSGGWSTALEYPLRVVDQVYPDIMPATVVRQEVAKVERTGQDLLVITDPPYYDQLGYADLSDFFYVWIRRALKGVYPELFSTLLTPKAEELAAVRHRFGGKRDAARNFFEEGFRDTFRRLRAVQSDEFPLCLFYAYKQRESGSDGESGATGWDTMLQGLHDAGWQITATVPMLSESTDTIKKQKSSLQTSIVFALRTRKAGAGSVSRQAFLSALREEVPPAIRVLQRSDLQPADLQQAAIGPGMAVYTRYDEVMDAEGKAVPVSEALRLIDRVVVEALEEQEDDFDSDTRWSLVWYEQFGFDEGPFGTAEVLSKTKNTSVPGLVQAGVVSRRGSVVRLLKPAELSEEWGPTSDSRLTVWEGLHHMIRNLESGGEKQTASLVKRMGSLAEVGKELAYRLYTIAERTGRTRDAARYNSLVQSWPEINRLAREGEAPATEAQTGLFEAEEG